MRARLVVLSWLLIATALVAAPLAAQTPDYWRDTAARPADAGAFASEAYRSVALDHAALQRHLAPDSAGANEIALPLPEGGYARFTLADSGTLPPELAARYPAIRSLIGTAADGTRARIDLSPIGLNAMVFAKDGIWLVRPESYGEGAAYLSFRRRALTRDPAQFRCSLDQSNVETASAAIALSEGTSPASTGSVRRTYRTAVAANAPYVAAIAGTAPPTVEIGLAAVVVAMNRVNEVYERDFSIHFTLVPDNDRIIYADRKDDPYTNGNGALSQNTPNLDAVIGAANYDLGHVFTTGSGVAWLDVVCSSDKGGGTTGLNAARLQSDAFYIDYVAHEIGHQLGGQHTFNGTISNCGDENRSAGSAYEPGSGSTIMAYAGICGNIDLQRHSDPYFHARSLQQIGNHTANAGCGVTENQTAAPPSVQAPATLTIPARTPYALTGSATGTSSTPIQYVWEQYDLGSANNDLASDPGAGPIQRSFLPIEQGTRLLPRLSTLLGGPPALGEILPTTTRTVSYRLTARAETALGGMTDYATTRVSVIDTGEAFAVTAPAAGTTWRYGADPDPTITWAVAGTDAEPIACTAVDIDLVAAVAGERLGVLAQLASGVPNDGLATVAIPNVERRDAHVRVACADNVFFAVSPALAVSGVDALFADGFED